MRFSIEPCVPADAHGIAATTMSAWHENWHWAYRWEDPSLEGLIERGGERVPWILTTERETKRHQKAVDVTTGEVVGYSRWLLPPDLAERNVWPEAQVPEPSPEDRVTFKERAKSLGKLRSEKMAEFLSSPLEAADARIMENGPYMVLDYLTVKPAFQRQGIAALLVKSGLEIADAYHQKAHVMSSEAALQLYKAHGFNVVETTCTDYSQFGATALFIHHFMVREAAAAENEDSPAPSRDRN